MRDNCICVTTGASFPPSQGFWGEPPRWQATNARLSQNLSSNDFEQQCQWLALQWWLGLCLWAALFMASGE
jgi:hypothetical protein